MLTLVVMRCAGGCVRTLEAQCAPKWICSTSTTCLVHSITASWRILRGREDSCPKSRCARRTHPTRHPPSTAIAPSHCVEQPRQKTQRSPFAAESSSAPQEPLRPPFSRRPPSRDDLVRRSRRPRCGPSQSCSETPLSCCITHLTRWSSPLLRRRDLLTLRPHEHHQDRQRSEVDLTVETHQGIGGTTPERSGGRPSRLVLPQHPPPVRAPLEAQRVSGIRARRSPGRGALRFVRQSCSLGCS